jgi:hypothetical protein
VRVVGRFRGQNRLGDIPKENKRPRSAWVIKAGRYAIWVTGRKPSGPGFKLNPDSEEDSTKWVEVVGRPETTDGVTVLRAVKVALTTAPSGSVLRGHRLTRSIGAPAVIFSLPLDGENVSANARFVVQFSAYMDDESFEGRVRLRSADEGGKERELERLRWSYDDARRALIVDPGEPLVPGSRVTLMLLAGILDIDGTAVPPAAGADEGVVKLLRYTVGN